MNPLFRMPQVLNPMQKIGQVINDVRMLQQNPSNIGNYLAEHGRINADQVESINKMGSPTQIGQFLMQNGALSQQGVQQAYQNIVPTIQKNL